MDSSVAEGISTSLESCPPFPQPQEPVALEGVPSPLSTAHLHENDLGLTPSPGSQLLQPTDIVQAPLRDEDHGFTKESEQPADLLVIRNRVNCSPIELSRTNTDQDGSALSTPEQVRASSPEAYEEVYDPLFDSEFPIPGLDTALDSRKRTGEEAFSLDFELWEHPEKRPCVESPQNVSVTSPGETPSLSPTDSSTRYAQGETAPHTPVGAQTQHSPSLFDTFDSLFGDSAMEVSFGLTNGEPLPNFEQAFDFTQDFPFHDAPDSGPSTKSLAGETKKAPDLAQLVADHTLSQPSKSDFTKQQFSLDSHDLLANTTREILQVKKEPAYMSPYPVSGGPLGYLPSAPGIHVKFVEVAEDQINHRLSALRAKVQQLTYERNHYKKALLQRPDVDASTGKTTEQKLREENAMLRRVSSRHQSRVEQYKQEAAEWKLKMHDLGVIYNNLLYEIGVQKRIPEIAPIPQGYKPPRNATTTSGGYPNWPNQEVICLESRPATQPPPAPPISHTGFHISRHHHSQLSPSNSGAHLEPRTTHEDGNNQLSNVSCGSPSRPSSQQLSTPLTIDLTDEAEDGPPATPDSTSKEADRGIAMMQSLRSKKYNWLSTMQGQPTGSRVASPATPPPGNNLFDDELARVMEEELARG